LNQVIAQSAKLLRRLIGEDISLTTVLASDLCPVKADPTQIEQVILNLAVNAKDAMSRGGKLTIETTNVSIGEDDRTLYPDLPPGRYVRLAVSDTGCGMTDDVKAKIFEPFFTTKEAGKGTGLGLSVVHGAVKSSGGRIDVYSEVGIGSAFKILWPASLEKPTSSFLSAQGAPTGTETVLIVEDDESVRKLSRIALEAHGYTVIEAESGASAIPIAREHRGNIHLLVTDVVMPIMGGRELADTLRLTDPRLKVIYVSGYTDDAVIRHGVIQSHEAFLQKPFTPMALTRKVRSVIDDAPRF
jgi:CheY-like chemotaxis protein